MPKKRAPKKSAAARSPALKSVGSATDPAVHQLIAQRQTAVMNQEFLPIDEIDRQLAKLGYQA